jgi:IclR family transcriptional regulator, acetate operon repressor
MPQYQDTRHDSDYTIRAVDRVCDLLDLLQETREGVSLKDAAHATGLPKSSVFRYLVSLEHRRYIEHDPESGFYRLGSAFMPVQARQIDLLVERAHPQLERVRDEVGETAALAILDSDEIIYLDVVESQSDLRLAPSAGGRAAVHATASGKMIAAQLDDDRVREVLASAGMQARTPRTIASIESFLEELEEVRTRGYAVDDGESTIQGRCVAVAVPDTHLPAAVSICAPASRMPLEAVKDLSAILLEAAQEIVGGGAHSSRRQK